MGISSLFNSLIKAISLYESKVIKEYNKYMLLPALGQIWFVYAYFGNLTILVNF